MKKRLTIFLTLILFVIAGCSIKLNNEKATEILVKAGSRIFAYQFLKKNPDQIDKVKFYCEALQEGDITQAAITTGILYLSDKIGNDPSLHAAFIDLRELIVVDVADPNFDPYMIHLVALGFIEGAALLE